MKIYRNIVILLLYAAVLALTLRGGWREGLHHNGTSLEVKDRKNVTSVAFFLLKYIGNAQNAIKKQNYFLQYQLFFVPLWPKISDISS